MDQLPWHNYDGESAEQLFALVPNRRIDSLVVAFEEAIGRKAAALGEQSLSTVERDVLAVEALEREVNNGGYAQFFLNSSNEYATTIVDALNRIGCTEVATITQRAIDALPPGTAMTPSGLEEEMARDNGARDVALGACDEAYYGAGEDIAGALMRYLQHNRDDVRFTG